MWMTTEYLIQSESRVPLSSVAQNIVEIEGPTVCLTLSTFGVYLVLRNVDRTLKSVCGVPPYQIGRLSATISCVFRRMVEMRGACVRLEGGRGEGEISLKVTTRVLFYLFFFLLVMLPSAGSLCVSTLFFVFF